MNNADKSAKVEAHRKAAGRAARELCNPKLKPAQRLAAAKVLEAAGCYIRRHGC